MALIERNKRAKAIRDEIPTDWDEWLKTLFPHIFYATFAEHHREYWQWVEAIKLGDKPDPFFAIWGRGGAKTTNSEAGVVRMGAMERRKFCLYVRGT